MRGTDTSSRAHCTMQLPGIFYAKPAGVHSPGFYAKPAASHFLSRAREYFTDLPNIIYQKNNISIIKEVATHE